LGIPQDKRLASGFAIETYKVKGSYKAHAQAHAILLNSCSIHLINTKILYFLAEMYI
jgi:hypothetical protein